MTEYLEEQEGELEALRSIYPEEELKVISEDPYCLEVKVQIENSESEDSQLGVEVQFQLPPTYPDEVPEVTITGGVGLDDGEMREMERQLNQQAVENVGTVMVFTLVCGVQELLEGVVERGREEREREKQRKEEETRRLDEAKYRGTIVTVESFREWRTRFEEEMREKRGIRPRDVAKTTTRLTGRQMFERDTSLALSDAKFLTEDDMESGQQDEVEVDESLFEDMDDLTLATES